MCAPKEETTFSYKKKTKKTNKFPGECPSIVYV